MIATTADVDARARVADSARIWHLAQIRENASIGERSIVGRGAYIDAGVNLGANCKIQNHALVYAPALVEDGVFIGPAAVLTNDAYPRSINPDGTLKDLEDWDPIGVTVRTGAAIGARAVVLGGVEVGEWAMVAAAAVVTRDVPPHSLVLGNPARHVGWVGTDGRRMRSDGSDLVDRATGRRYREVDGRLTNL